jgi:hypothetical protein
LCPCVEPRRTNRKDGRSAKERKEPFLEAEQHSGIPQERNHHARSYAFRACEISRTPVISCHRPPKVNYFNSNDLRAGSSRAVHAGMKRKLLLTMAMILLWPALARAGAQERETNVNERYDVESVELSGASESKLSKGLNDDLQKMVGEKYSQETANDLAKKLRKELREYSVTVKVKRGDTPDHVKVIFEAERIRWKRFEVPIPPVVYHTKEGFSGAIEIPLDFHHNIFTF